LTARKVYCFDIEAADRHLDGHFGSDVQADAVSFQNELGAAIRPCIASAVVHGGDQVVGGRSKRLQVGCRQEETHYRR